MSDLISRINTLLKEEHEWAAETKLTGMWDDAPALKSYLEDLYVDYKEMYELKHMGADADELQSDIETIESRVVELGGTLPGREVNESVEVIDINAVRDLILKVEEKDDIYDIVVSNVTNDRDKIESEVISIVKNNVNDAIKSMSEEPTFNKDKFSKEVINSVIDNLVKIVYNRDLIGNKLFTQDLKTTQPPYSAETVEMNSIQYGTKETTDILNQDKIKLQDVEKEKEIKSEFDNLKEEIISSKLNLLYEAPESIADIKNEAKNLKVYEFEIKRNLGPQKIGNYLRVNYADRLIDKYVMKKLWFIRDSDESNKKYNAKYKEALEYLKKGGILFTGTPFGNFIVTEPYTLAGKVMDWKGGSDYNLNGKPLEVMQ